MLKTLDTTPTTPMPDEHDFGYYGVQPAQLKVIRLQGLTEPGGLHFSSSPDHGHTWGPPDELLRFPVPDASDDCDACGGDTFMFSDGCVLFTNLFTEDAIPPEHIEVLTDDDTWQPLLLAEALR